VLAGRSDDHYRRRGLANIERIRMELVERETIDALLRVDLRDYVGRFGLYRLVCLFKAVAEDLAAQSSDAARLAQALDRVLTSMDRDL
jgi:hypothetical protein